MKKLPFAFATAILVLIMLISGCKGGGSSKGLPIPEIFTGIEGLDAHIDPQSVPSVVTAGSSSDIVLIISNKGALKVPASQATPALITFRDTRGAFTLDKVDIKGSESLYSYSPTTPLIKVTGDLDGRESTGTAGYFDGLRLTMKAKDFTGSDEPVDTGLLVTSCYQYNTKMTANVCVDATAYSFKKQRKACDASQPIVLKSQGAPVAITRIETITERYDGGIIRPKFKIFISNVGNGLVINKNNLDLFCTASNEKKDKGVNLVYIDSVTLNDKGLECNDKDAKGNKAGFALSGSQAKDYLLCSYTGDEFKEDSGIGTFATPLKAQLSYGYTTTSSAIPIRVEKGLSCKPGNTRACTKSDNTKGTQTCSDNGLWSAGCA